MKKMTETQSQLRSTLDALDSPLDRYKYLSSLRNSSANMMYKHISLDPGYFLPILYTPTVGAAAKQFSSVEKSESSLFISPNEDGLLGDAFDHIPNDSIDIVVITDGSRVLGFGDLGIGGMAISIGKSDVYRAFTNIDFERVLPICIDIGTNNKELLKDTTYKGIKKKRLEWDRYTRFLNSIVLTIMKKFPRAILHWEDFSTFSAQYLMKKYKHILPSFNDDIEGTASAVLSGILCALETHQKNIKHQKFCIFGAGAAGCGVAVLLKRYLQMNGLSEMESRNMIYLFDKRGLVVDDDDQITPEQSMFARSSNSLADKDITSLKDVISFTGTTVLIGASAVSGAFEEDVIKELVANTETPIILPLSNPHEKAEISFANAIRWTNGKAITAFGSVCAAVRYNSKTFECSQCNNLFIFPGIAAGVIQARIRYISPDIFIVAAKALSSFTMAKYKGSRIFPNLSDLQEVTEHLKTEIINYSNNK